jgi:hypothetical protein
MAASQNGFLLSIHKKINIMQTMTKNITIFFINLIFYHREIVKIDHFTDTFLELCEHRCVMQPLQNPPFCSCTLKQCIISLRFEAGDTRDGGNLNLLNNNNSSCSNTSGGLASAGIRAPESQSSLRERPGRPSRPERVDKVLKRRSYHPQDGLSQVHQ